MPLTNKSNIFVFNQTMPPWMDRFFNRKIEPMLSDDGTKMLFKAIGADSSSINNSRANSYDLMDEQFIKNNALKRKADATGTVTPASRSLTPVDFFLERPVYKMQAPVRIKEKLEQNQSSTLVNSDEIKSPRQPVFFLHQSDSDSYTGTFKSLFSSNLELTQKLVNLISDILDDHAQNRPVNYYLQTIYCSSKNKYSVSDLILRLIAMVPDALESQSETMFTVMLVYLDAWLARKSDYFHTNNINQLILCSALLAIKYTEDERIYKGNGYLADLGGLNVEKMDEMELAFIKDLNFELSVSPNTYEEYCTGLFRYRTNADVLLTKSIQPQVHDEPDPGCVPGCLMM